jgi:hypothetical protein
MCQVPTVVSVSRLKCSEESLTRLSSGTRTSGTMACWRRTTGRRCPAPWTVWRSDEYSEAAFTHSLTAKGSLHGSMTASRISTCGQGWRSRQTAADKAGVFCGNLFCCLNYDSQAVELYNGSTLLGSYSQRYCETPNADLRTDPNMYTVEMRIRGNKVRVYSGSSYTLRFTATVSGFSGGYAGYRSDNRTVCELMRLGDAWTYEPYERFDVVMPDGTQKSYGSISGATAHGTANSRCSR